MRKIFILVFIFVVFLSNELAYVYANESQDDSQVEITDQIPDDAGTYFYRLYYKDDQNRIIDKIIKVTVTLPKTVFDEENSEGINAYDFKIPKGTIDSLTLSDLINYGSARAWDTITGKTVPITSVEVKRINSFLLEVTYTTQKGTSTMVQALEFNKSVLHLDKTFLQFYEAYRFINLRLSTILIVISLISVIVALVSFFVCFKEFWKTREVLYSKTNKRVIKSESNSK